MNKLKIDNNDKRHTFFCKIQQQKMKELWDNKADDAWNDA